MWRRCHSAALSKLHKWLQTWTLIHSVMRSPKSDSLAEACQASSGSPSGSESKKKTFKGNCFFFSNEIVIFWYLLVIYFIFFLLFKKYLLLWVRAEKSVFPLFLFKGTWVVSSTSTYENYNMLAHVCWCVTGCIKSVIPNWEKPFKTIKWRLQWTKKNPWFAS